MRTYNRCVTQLYSHCVWQMAAYCIVVSWWIDWLTWSAWTYVVTPQLCSFWYVCFTLLQVIIKFPAGQISGKLTSRHQVSALLLSLSAASGGDLEELRRPLSSSDSPSQSARRSAAAAVSGSSLGIHFSLCHLSHSISVRAHFMSRPKAIG